MIPLVIIPTYQERSNLEAIIRGVFAEGPYHLLIVDDDSPDGTGELAESLRKEFPEELHIIHREGKMGLGSAYVEGFQFALAHSYDPVFEMDADFSHDPKYLPDLYMALEESDVVIGSRYLEGTSVVNWSLHRIALSFFANVYARFFTGLKIHDCTSGFKAFRRKVLESLPLNSIRSDGYAFQIEVSFLAQSMGFALKEVPIIFVDRSSGESKMSGRIVWEAIGAVLRMGISRPRWRRSRKARNGNTPR